MELEQSPRDSLQFPERERVNGNQLRTGSSLAVRIGNIAGTINFYGQVLKETFLASSINILTTRNQPDRSHEYFVDLLRRSPKVPVYQQTRDEREHGHAKFGNNFFMLFSELQSQEADPEAYRRRSPVQVYTAQAEERYGEKWLRFKKNNRGLIDQIYQELDRYGTYLELLEHYKDLLIAERSGANSNIADEFRAMGIGSVEIYVWRKLNSLLKKAANQMKKQGINPQEFFG